MAHELDFSKGSAAIAYVGETPWHQYGTAFTEPMTAQQCIEHGGLDYTVEIQPLMTVPNETSEGIKLRTHNAVVRTDTEGVLGVVGNDYRPLQNRDAFTFFDAIVDEGQARYETCGALKEGRQIWLLAKIDGQFDVLPNDTIDKYLLLTNRHDGLGCVQARCTNIRVVCNNTLSAALGRNAKDELRIVHKGDVAGKLEFAGNLLRQTQQFFDETQEVYKALAKIQLNEQKLTSFLQMSLRPYYGTTPTEDQEEISAKLRKEVEVVKRLHEVGRGATIKGVRGTLWGAYNSVTEYVDHYKVPKRAEKIEFLGFGTGKLIKDHSLNLAIRYRSKGTFSTSSEVLVTN